MDRRGCGPGEVGAASQSSPPDAAGILHAGGGFVGNTGITLIGAVAGALLGIGNEVLAARFLGVSAYGLYALALMVAKAGEVLTLFGVPASVMHYLPVHLGRGERAEAFGTVLAAIPLPLMAGLGLALALWLGGAEWVAAHLLGQPDAARFLVVLGFAIPLLALTDLFGNIARALGHGLPYVLIRNLTPQLCLTGVLVALLVWRGPQTGIAYGQVGGLAAGTLLGVALVWHLTRARIGNVRPLLQPVRLYAFALPVVINTVMSLAMALIDLFMLGLLTDAGTVGAYRGCMQIVVGFDLLLTALAAATAPLYTVLIAEGRSAALQATYTAAIRVAALMALPVLVIVVANGGDLLALLGPAFVVATPALLILACGQATKVAFGAAAIVLTMGRRQVLDAGNVALAATADLVLNLLLIPRFGMVGAALATTLSLFALAALRCLELRRLMGLRTFDPVQLRTLLLSAAAALAVLAGSVLLGVGPGSGVEPLVLRVTVMGVVMSVGLWFWCLAAEDRAMLLRLALRRGPAAVTADPTAGARYSLRR